jgi:hypothetical protein
MRRMRAATAALAVACLVISTPAWAQNLLENPDFDLTPVGNGWSAIGTGSVVHQLSEGQPPPSAELSAEGTESIDLVQCRPVSGDTVYALVARTYTTFASGASTNTVRVRWFGLEGCSNELDSQEITTAVYPEGEFSRRYDNHLVPPIDAQSAQVELEVVANGSPSQVRFDAIYLPEPSPSRLAYAALAVLFVRRRRS